MNTTLICDEIQKNLGELFEVTPIGDKIILCLLNDSDKTKLRKNESALKFFQNLRALSSEFKGYHKIQSGIERAYENTLGKLHIPLKVLETQKNVRISPFDDVVTLEAFSDDSFQGSIAYKRQKCRNYTRVNRTLEGRRPRINKYSNNTLSLDQKNILEFIKPETELSDFNGREKYCERKSDKRILKIDIVYKPKGNEIYGEIKPDPALAPLTIYRRAAQIDSYDAYLSYIESNATLALLLPTFPSYSEIEKYNLLELDRRLNIIIPTTSNYLKNDIKNRKWKADYIEKHYSEDWKNVDLETYQNEKIFLEYLEDFLGIKI